MDWPPGTQERISLAKVEAQLRTFRVRFNLYTAQHQLYSMGTVLALGVALFTILAFSLSSFWFTLAAWPLFALVGFVCFRFLRRGITDWTNINTAARRVDLQVGLKQRLSTIAAQITAGAPDVLPASRLWTYLLRDNMDRLPTWEVKKVGPSRVPWSLLPFLGAVALAFFIASIPLLSPASEPVPFTLTNLDLVASELPERAGRLVGERLSMLPENPQAPPLDPLRSGETITQQEDQQGEQREQEGLGQEFLSLASLPENIQQAIRSALQGLAESDEQRRARQGDSAAEERPTLNPGQDGDGLFGSQEEAEQQAAAEGQAGKDGQGQSAGKGSSQGPEQGSGIQKLQQARLERRQTASVFEPANPQLPSKGGQAGRGGPGAGSGTDQRLLGNEKDLGAPTPTFRLSLDASFEKSRTGTEIVKDEGGGVIIKSTSQLNQNQALDDAIRNAQIPPEYEDIVKRLFSRGEVQ